MSDIIKFNSDREIVTEQNGEIVRECNDLAEMTEEMLLDARKEIANTKTLSAPIAELALLGTGVASLIPALRKVTQTTTKKNVKKQYRPPNNQNNFIKLNILENL